MAHSVFSGFLIIGVVIVIVVFAFVAAAAATVAITVVIKAQLGNWSAAIITGSCTGTAAICVHDTEHLDCPCTTFVADRGRQHLDTR